MTSKAEIEAQIEALKRKLKESEMDADFTPTELVRWDPSLLGTVLHLKYHGGDIPRTAGSFIIEEGADVLMSVYYKGDSEGIVSRMEMPSKELKMEQFGVLTNTGITTNNDIDIKSYQSYLDGSLRAHGNKYTLLYDCVNNFQSLNQVPIISYLYPENLVEKSLRIIHKDDKFIKMNYRDLKYTMFCQNRTSYCRCPHSRLGQSYENYRSYLPPGKCLTYKGMFPLCEPDDNLLDKIHIAKVVKLPFQDKEVIIDLYPLSKLYKEWKADKDAKRPVRAGVKWHGIRPEWAGDETLSWRTKPSMEGSRHYCSTAEKKVDTHISSCDCTMCVVTKDHP